MQSITLQTSDSAITVGDILGRLNFAASSESDGGAAVLQVGSIYAVAEGTFSASANPTSIIIATSASDSSPAQNRIKITNEGHIHPMTNNAYDLGSSSLRYRAAYVNALTINSAYSFPTADGSSNQFLQTDGAGNLTFQSATVSDISDLTATATELNLLDGVTNITLGSANELLVVGSDGASIVSDSTLAVDTTNNRLGINQTSPEVTLHMTGEGAQTSQIRMEQYNDSADAPDIRTRRYRGTTASPSGVQAGDYLFRSNHEYYNGTSLIVGGQFAFDNTNNANRTQFTIAVTTDGTSVEASSNDDVQFKIDGNDGGAITFNNAYKFPTSDGSANQVLQTDGSGSLSFATVSTGSAYTAGSGLTLTGTQFNVYGGSGNFEYLELQTDNTTIPKIKFTGSGVTDTPVSLEVASSFESATGSGSALLFQGTQGQLFSITDNLSSGTIFSVSDITGLPMLEIDASGHVQIGEFADDITIHQPVLLSGGIPSSTTNKLYNGSGTLYWDGNPLVELPPSGLESQILYKVSDASNELAWIDNYATELRELVKNDTGSDILKGTAVMATGAVGDRIQVAPATADGSVEARYMLGIASEDITNSTEGYVTLVGPIKGVNTGSYTVGTVLWLDPDNDGELTTTQPSSPNLQMSVAIVTSSNASSGRIFVRMWEQQPGLHELHDVNVDVGLASGDLIAYNSSNSTWENITNPSGYLQSQIDLKANIASPTFTGTPAAPTASAGTNTTQLATTAFVSTAVANLVDSAPTTLDTLNELAAALGDDANFSTTITNSLAGKLSDVVDDTTPQLGGGLDINGYDITGDGSINISGIMTASGERVITSDEIYHIRQLTQAEYDAITPDSATFYIITDASEDAAVSGYFESRVDLADANILTVSGLIPTGTPSGVNFFGDDGSVTGNNTFTYDGVDVALSGNIIASGKRVITSDEIYHIKQLTQAQYDAITPDAATFYIITDPDVEGPVVQPIKTVTSDYTILTTDYTVYATSGLTLTLPTAVGNGGILFNIKSGTSSTVYVSGVSSQTIDGQNPFSISTPYQSVTLQSTNSNWIIV